MDRLRFVPPALAAALLAVLAFRLTPRSGAALDARLDALFADVFRAGEPGAEVLVRVHGATRFRRVYGQLAPGAVTRGGSLTKPMVAVVAASLAAEHKLAFDDPISKVLSQAGDAGAATLEDLLGMSSGLALYDPRGADRSDVTLGGLLVKVLAAPPTFAPGTKFEFNDANYLVAGSIVTAAGGAPLGELLRARVFAPAGMTRSALDGDAPPGHDLDENGAYVVAPAPRLPGYAAEGLVTTADDLAAFAEAFVAGKLVSAEWVRRLTAPRNPPYALGWRATRTRWRRVLDHPGDFGGDSSALTILPDDGVVAIVLANRFQPRPRPDDLALDAALLTVGAPVLTTLDFLLCALTFVALLATLVTGGTRAGRSERRTR